MASQVRGRDLNSELPAFSCVLETVTPLGKQSQAEPILRFLRRFGVFGRLRRATRLLGGLLLGILSLAFTGLLRVDGSHYFCFSLSLRSQFSQPALILPSMFSGSMTNSKKAKEG